MHHNIGHSNLHTYIINSPLRKTKADTVLRDNPKAFQSMITMNGFSLGAVVFCIYKMHFHSTFGLGHSFVNMTQFSDFGLLLPILSYVKVMVMIE